MFNIQNEWKTNLMSGNGTLSDPFVWKQNKSSIFNNLKNPLFNKNKKLKKSGVLSDFTKCEIKHE